MSEEEKKAIEMIKYLKENNSLIGFKPTNRDNLADTILNLIQKQQKEIEELKDKIKRLKDIVIKYGTTLTPGEFQSINCIGTMEIYNFIREILEE